MDPLSSVMSRAALTWLMAGFVIGAAMLTDRALPGQWRLWMAPSHAHMLFVGWFLQFAVGVAYWLLPRQRSPERPLGYREGTAYLAVGALNLGLVLRIIAEPAERTGHESDLTMAVLIASALLQVAAALMFIVQLWPRVAARPLRGAHERSTR
jgi:vacuolar-type H+-ATPase subunit I/STV1